MPKDRVKVAIKYRKKRIFHGNRFTNKKDENVSVEEDENQQVESQSAPTVADISIESAGVSFSKVENIDVSTPCGNRSRVSGYRMIDCAILDTVFNLFNLPRM